MSKEIEFCNALRAVLAKYEADQYIKLGSDQITGHTIAPLLGSEINPIERNGAGGFDLRYTKLGTFRPDNQGIFQAYLFDLRAREQIQKQQAALADDLLQSEAQKEFKKLKSDLKRYVVDSGSVLNEPSVSALGRSVAQLFYRKSEFSRAKSPAPKSK